LGGFGPLLLRGRCCWCWCCEVDFGLCFLRSYQSSLRLFFFFRDDDDDDGDGDENEDGPCRGGFRFLPDDDDDDDEDDEGRLGRGVDNAVAV